MNVFDELLAIKRFREGQSELAVKRQREVYAEAQRRRDHASEQLAEYKVWAHQREDSLYQDLCSRTVRAREIEDVLQDVAELRLGESDRLALVETANDDVAVQYSALDDCRVLHKEASRMTQKFVQLAHEYLVEYLYEVQRKEDQEMEEAASVCRERDDWTQHDEDELP